MSDQDKEDNEENMPSDSADARPPVERMVSYFNGLNIEGRLFKEERLSKTQANPKTDPLAEIKEDEWVDDIDDHIGDISQENVNNLEKRISTIEVGYTEVQPEINKSEVTEEKKETEDDQDDVKDEVSK